MSLENMEVFEDTIKLCETNGKIRESIAQSVKNQKLIPEWSDLPDVEKRRFPEYEEPDQQCGCHIYTGCNRI